MKIVKGLGNLSALLSNKQSSNRKEQLAARSLFIESIASFSYFEPFFRVGLLNKPAELRDIKSSSDLSPEKHAQVKTELSLALYNLLQEDSTKLDPAVKEDFERLQEVVNIKKDVDAQDLFSYMAGAHRRALDAVEEAEYTHEIFKAQTYKEKPDLVLLAKAALEGRLTIMLRTKEISAEEYEQLNTILESQDEMRQQEVVSDMRLKKQAKTFSRRAWLTSTAIGVGAAVALNSFLPTKDGEFDAPNFHSYRELSEALPRTQSFIRNLIAQAKESVAPKGVSKEVWDKFIEVLENKGLDQIYYRRKEPSSKGNLLELDEVNISQLGIGKTEDRKVYISFSKSLENILRKGGRPKFKPGYIYPIDNPVKPLQSGGLSSGYSMARSDINHISHPTTNRSGMILKRLLPILVKRFLDSKDSKNLPKAFRELLKGYPEPLTEGSTNRISYRVGRIDNDDWSSYSLEEDSRELVLAFNANKISELLNSIRNLENLSDEEILSTMK